MVLAMMLARYLGGLLGGIGLVLRRIWGWFWGGLGWFWGGGKWGSLEMNCKKMQKKCKKMQKYLHMSKKSCNFASDFNSGVRNNQNQIRVMKKECVFKCQIKGNWYRVYECVHPDDEHRTYYQTYVGRRRLDSCTWSAVGSAIGSILCEFKGNVVGDLIETWK